MATFKSINQQVTELLNSNFTVKNIFELIQFSSRNEIAWALIDLIAENSNDFTKDIANKLNQGIELTQKQMWCLAYQIFNNKQVYILAQSEYCASCEIETEVKDEVVNVLVLRTGNNVNQMLIHNNMQDEMIFDESDIEVAKIEFEKEENVLKEAYILTNYFYSSGAWNEKFEPKESDLVRVELSKATITNGQIEITETLLISDDFFMC